MKYAIILSISLVVFFLAGCDPPREYVEFPALAHPAAPGELEQAVRKFLSENGDDSEFSFRARKYSEEVFLIKAETEKSAGYGLIARKIRQDGQIYWKVDYGTIENFNRLGIAPLW